MKRLIMILVLSGALGDPDHVLNRVVNRILLVGARMRAYSSSPATSTLIRVVGGAPAKVLGKRRGPLSYEFDFRPSWY